MPSFLYNRITCSWRLLALLLFINFCQTAHAAPVCSSILGAQKMSDLSPESPTWIDLTTRNGKIIDQKYPQRLHDSLTSIFDSWVDKYLGGEKLDFISMLRQQHRVLSVGKNGDDVYQGYSAAGINKIIGRKAIPGHFRNEGPSFSIESLPWIISIPNDMLLDASRMNHSQKWYERVSIPGIPTEYLPKRWPRGKTIFYQYPSRGGVPFYLAVMEKSLTQALDVLRENRPASEVLPFLADYLQAGLVGHLFGIGNFSLYMTQVNDILLRAGYKGIPPKQLDFQAVVEDSENFRKVFASLTEPSTR